MIIGQKYRNDRGIYVMDKNGIYTLGMMFNGEFAGLLKPSGIWMRVYPLENGKLTEYLNTPLNGYKYYQGRYAFKHNSRVKITGKYPDFYDDKGRRVWINLDRTFTTVPYDYEAAIQAEYDRKLDRRRERRREVEYKVDIRHTHSGTNSEAYYEIREIDSRSGEGRVVFKGTGLHKRYCQAAAKAWIERRKKRLTAAHG